MHQHNVLQTIAGHVGTLDARVGEVDVGELRQRSPLDRMRAMPAALRVVEETLQTAAGAQGIGDAITVQVEQFDFRVFQIEAGGKFIRLERPAVSQSTIPEREIA